MNEIQTEGTLLHENLFWYNALTKDTVNTIRDNVIITDAQVDNPGGWEGSVSGVAAAYLDRSTSSAVIKKCGKLVRK